jgi:hypothetical protein
MVLEIVEMIHQEKDSFKKDILRKLMILNKDALEYMSSAIGKGKPYSRERYNAMWKERFWKEAKWLLCSYFFEDGLPKCQQCGKDLPNYFTLHHQDFYNNKNYFTPHYVEILCNTCHQKEHQEGK